MRVLLVNTVATDKNGITRVIENMAAHMDRQGLQLDYLSVQTADTGCLQVITDRGGRVFEIPRRIRGAVRYVARLARLVRREGYDILHAHGNSGTLALEMLGAWLGGCKVRIAHIHNTACTHKTAHQLLKPLLHMLCTHRLACGEDAGRWLYGRRDFRVIHNGIDTAAFTFDAAARQQLRKAWGVGEEEFLLGHVGTFHATKNQQFLLELLPHLQWHCRLALVGEGELLDAVSELAEERGLLRLVNFVGATDRVADCLSAFDLFVLPSYHEGLPLVLIEAQANGLACLASDRVTAEADLTGNVRYLPLDSRKAWVQAIENRQIPRDRATASRQAAQKITAAGYEAADAAAGLKAYYENAICDK